MALVCVEVVAVALAATVAVPAGPAPAGVTAAPALQGNIALAAWDEDPISDAIPPGSPGEQGPPESTVGEGSPTGGEVGVEYADPTTGHPWATSVTRAFDPPAQDWLPGHRGVDLYLAVGDPVLAAGEGSIAFSGPVAGTPVVSIDHADGVRTTYQPVRPRVSEGDAVSAGEVIGYLSHPTDGWPGLHWGARVGEEYLNPLSLLIAPTIRLKPVDAPGGRPLGAAGH